MKLPQRLSLHAGFWLVLLLSVFAWAPATYPGYWQSLEGFTPVFNASHPLPLATIATQPDLWRGMGSGTFLISRPFLAVGLTPTAAVRAGFILVFLLGGLGCYSWLQTYLGDRAAGLAGLIYIFSPPLLATIYLRGSLSDAVIVMLLPLALAGLATYCQTRALSAAGIAVIAIFWMWQTQAGMAALTTILLLGYVLAVERQWMALLIVVVSGAAGLSSLAPVINSTAAAPVFFAEHFLYPFQLLQAHWQFAPSIPGWQDQFPFQLSLPALLYSCFSLWGLVQLWHSRSTLAGQPPLLAAQPSEPPLNAEWRVARLWLFCALATLLLTLSTFSFTLPLWQWTHAERLLSYPWQMLLLTVPLWAMMGGTLPTVQRLFRQTPSWVVAAALVVLSSFPYLSADFTTVIPPVTPIALFGEASEIVILDVVITENRQPRVTEVAITWQVLHPLTTDYNLFFQALRGNAQALTMVQQLDVQPLGVEEPPTSWQQGKIYQSTYRLDLDGIPADAQLTYYLGFYDWFTGVRLPVNWGIDDKLTFYGE